MLTAAIAFLRRYGQLAAVVTLVGWLMLACHQRDQAIEQRGRAIERVMQRDRDVARYQATAKQQAARADSLEHVVRADTVRLAKWLTRWDTVTRTINIHDTTAVVNAIATADSTIRSCKATVLDLVSSCAAKDALLATKDSIIGVLRATPAVVPPDRRLSLGVTGGYGATLSNGSVHTGPSIAMGGTWRIW